MFTKKIFILPILIIALSIIGCTKNSLQNNLTQPNSTIDDESSVTDVDDSKTEEEKQGETNEATSQKFCEIGKKYEHTAISKITCECPENYEFKTISMGWGPCPREGMSGCPASVLECVKKTE